MYNPTTRVLAMLEMLQSRGTVSGAELVERLEVDARTVRRYVTMLRDIGVPVESAPGRGGGYRLGQGSKLPPLMFDDDEALAVVISLLQAIAWGRAGVEQRDIESALTKIGRVLPRDLKLKLAAVQAGVAFTSYDPAAALAAPPPDTDASIILTLAGARLLGQRVSLDYRGWRGVETSREVDPYGLVQHLGIWYLAGWCHLRDDVRVFRLDRIQTLDLTRETFTPPESFDALTYVSRALAAAPYTWKIEVLLDAPLEQLAPLVPATLANLRASDGGVLLEARAGNLAGMARFLAGLNCPFVVREPDELREELAKLAAELSRASRHA